MNLTEQSILRYMKAGHEYTNADVSADLTIPSKQCTKIMQRLVTKGLLEVASERSARSGQRRYRKVTV